MGGRASFSCTCFDAILLLQYPNIFEGADSVGGQKSGEYPVKLKSIPLVASPVMAEFGGRVPESEACLCLLSCVTASKICFNPFPALQMFYDVSDRAFHVYLHDVI